MSRWLLLLAFGCATPASSDTSKPIDPYAEHVTALRKRLASKGFTKIEILIEKPFVVVGDAGAAALRHDASTVKWAIDHLEADFFAVRPTKIIDIFLFRDAESYERGVKRLTGEDPDTPYGFYSKTHGGMFMNIATGGGTLVHEIVHPYVEADFPNAPPWLNEGLGSLFEQSADRDGHIVGLTNWRLEGLQHAIRDKRVPSFQALTHLSTDVFYNGDSGVNYAASRYLLYYLQERGKLRDFYHAFRAARAKDPSGYQTLVATLGAADMSAFEKQWRAYVGKLTFP